jgi:hypothetical protein
MISFTVMPGLVPGIHGKRQAVRRSSWIAGTSRTAVQLSEIGCSVLATTLVMVVITGLVPVIHAFFPF